MSEGRPSLSYVVRPIPSDVATRMVVQNHYLHRRASAMYCFGLFDGTTMLGCIIYGKPASPAPCKGVCGPDEAAHVIELTRLWVSDSSERNAESYLIGASLRMLPREFDVILSYAEIAAGHRGVVYQATNWLYTGLSSAHKDWTLDGEDGAHVRHRLDEVGGIVKARAIYGARLQPYERGRKHRYVMLRGSRARRRELREKLRYAVQSYPTARDAAPVAARAVEGEK